MLILVALGLAGCGRGTVSQGGSAGPAGDEPWGHTFLSTSVRENGQDRPLRETKWVVDTIVDGQSASSAPAGAEAFLVFERSGERFQGNTGCNGMGGNSVIHESTSTITFSEVISTTMACSDDRMRLERAVLATLAGDVRYKVEAAFLTLDGPNGHGLRLRASS